MMNLMTWILRIVVFVILAVFASKNSQPVTLQYYLDKSLELPLSVVLLIFFALGIFITLLFGRRADC
ncbi:LapA family protein [Nitrosomonas sp. JL21]|uniref:lipopolysaccharide assembly protein LapA domain-containing protein n=1 Tax=Nitrosomonas sp. JL21 TaxID=153949 RepID=UPI00136D68D0|nr:LapA family protein [Nitrosomonas sp.]MCC7091219.1 LapA family protein [Nitrosomonas sp.]MXS78987.1 LapA family protein [Nitrosomonas sp. JL21]